MMKRSLQPGTKPIKTWRSPVWVWIGVSILAIAVLVVGYLGLAPAGSSPQSSPPASTVKATLFPPSYRVTALTSGQQVAVVRGPRLTVIMLMASWCLYCAYEDKYVWPQVIRSIPGVEVNIVDVSRNGGIGDPGPQSPAFSGHDNVGPHISVAGMRQTMLTYQKQFDLHAPNLHIFVDPTGLTYWHMTTYPTFLFVNGTGHIVDRVNGALTRSQLTTIIHRLEH